MFYCFKSVSMQVETPSPSVEMVVDVIQDQKHTYERYSCVLDCTFFG